MGIWPVKINDWYVEDKAFGAQIDTLKFLLKVLRCDVCGKRVRWDRGYAMHSITFGGPSGLWCSKKCLEAE